MDLSCEEARANMLAAIRQRIDETVACLRSTGVASEEKTSELVAEVNTDIESLESALREMVQLQQKNEELTTKLAAAHDCVGNQKVLNEFTECRSTTASSHSAVDPQPNNVLPSEAPAPAKKTVRLKLPDETTAAQECIILPIQTAEFEAVPKYQRGRLDLKDLNAIISTLDGMLHKKEKILKAARQRKKLSSAEKALYDKWLEQETLANCSELGCSEQDLKNELPDKLKGIVRTTLPILRHCKRIREVRKPKIVFIIPVNSAA